MMKNVLRATWFALLLAGASGFFSGCATDDSAPKDPHAWDGPQNWENPLPANMNNGR